MWDHERVLIEGLLRFKVSDIEKYLPLDAYPFSLNVVDSIFVDSWMLSIPSMIRDRSLLVKL